MWETPIQVPAPERHVHLEINTKDPQILRRFAGKRKKLHTPEAEHKFGTRKFAKRKEAELRLKGYDTVYGPHPIGTLAVAYRPVGADTFAIRDGKNLRISRKGDQITFDLTESSKVAGIDEDYSGPAAKFLKQFALWASENILPSSDPKEKIRKGLEFDFTFRSCSTGEYLEVVPGPYERASTVAVFQASNVNRFSLPVKRFAVLTPSL